MPLWLYEIIEIRLLFAYQRKLTRLNSFTVGLRAFRGFDCGITPDKEGQENTDGCANRYQPKGIVQAHDRHMLRDTGLHYRMSLSQ